MPKCFDSYIADDFHLNLRKTPFIGKKQLWEVVRALGIEKAVNLAGDMTYYRVIGAVENALCYIEKKRLRRGSVDFSALVLGFIGMKLSNNDTLLCKKGRETVRSALRAKSPPCCGADAEEWIRKSDLWDIASSAYTTNAFLAAQRSEKVLLLQNELKKLGLRDANGESIVPDGIFGPQTYNFCEMLRRENAHL